MANDLTKNPWIIDTAAPTVLSRDLLRVEMVIWDGSDIAIGDQVIVQDLDGRKPVSLTADTAKEGAVLRFGTRFQLNGLIVPTMTHGKLSVYLA